MYLLSPRCRDRLRALFPLQLADQEHSPTFSCLESTAETLQDPSLGMHSALRHFYLAEHHVQHSAQQEKTLELYRASLAQQKHHSVHQTL